MRGYVVVSRYHKWSLYVFYRGVYPYIDMQKGPCISLLVPIHLLLGCIPPTAICSSVYTSPLVVIYLLQGCIPLAVIDCRHYISPLVVIPLLNGCTPRAVIVVVDIQCHIIIHPLHGCIPPAVICNSVTAFRCTSSTRVVVATYHRWYCTSSIGAYTPLATRNTIYNSLLVCTHSLQGCIHPTAICGSVCTSLRGLIHLQRCGIPLRYTPAVIGSSVCISPRVLLDLQRGCIPLGLIHGTFHISPLVLTNLL